MRVQMLLVLSLLVGVSACASDGSDSSMPDPPISTSTEPSATSVDNDDPDSSASKLLTSDPATTPPIGPADEFAPGPASLPVASAPGGLGDTVLPEDTADAVELFGALPNEFHGVQRDIAMRGPGQFSADYQSDDRACGPTGLQALDLSVVEADGFYPEGSMAEDVVAVFATGADWEVGDAGRDGDLFWVTWQTECSGESVDGVEWIFSATWGQVGSSLVFFAGAPDADSLDELVSIFVDAAATRESR